MESLKGAWWSFTSIYAEIVFRAIQEFYTLYFPTLRRIIVYKISAHMIFVFLSSLFALNSDFDDLYYFG